ncbi:hypothetical protein AA313_de0207177 [Arthrobotrys entomopaga]|nr:hypothetical protein AA313_de0207177 [Arthrobotrys entomopaga]
MGLLISRYIIEMENRQQIQRCEICHPLPAPNPEDEIPTVEDPDAFHPSKRFRFWLGVGIVIQAVCGLFLCLAFFFVPFTGPYDRYSFTVEIFRLFILIYAILFLHNTIIWFLCVYYNTAIPKDRTFLALEFIRSVPWLLLVLFFVTFWVIGVIQGINYWSRYPPWGNSWYGIYQWIFTAVIFVILWVLAVWSLFWMFFWFIKTRKEEIKKMFRLGGQDDENSSAQVDEERGEVGRERGGTEAEPDEDTPLLVNQSHLV